MQCLVVCIVGLFVSAWVVHMLIGMQRTTPPVKIFKTFDEILLKFRNTATKREALLLLWCVYLDFNKKGVIALAAPIIVGLGIFIGALCGPDWLGILNAIPPIIKAIRDLF